MSAASAANTRDAPRDGRPSAPAARPRRAAPLEAARRSCGAASLCRAGRASGGPDDGPRVNRRNRPGRGASASGRSRHRSRAPSRRPARPCAPCRARAAAWPRPTARPTFYAPRPPRAASRFGRVRAGVANVPSPVFLDGSPVRLPPAPAGRASARKNNVKSPRREEPSEAVPGDAVCCRRPDGGKGCAINRAKYPPYPIPITLQHATRNKHS